jgi:3-isopropylmalate/(R)-2-methylmalate dehydratase large subunit
VNRIFYRSAVNQGLPIIVLPEAVDAFGKGDTVDINFEKGELNVGGKVFPFSPLPDKLMKIFEEKGLVNYLKKG